MPDTLLPQEDMRPKHTRRRFAHMRTIMALILREMASRYGRTPGGYMWAVLEPLGMIVVLALGFSLVVRSPPLGNSFILFYATGYLPYSLFQRGSNVVMTALKFSRQLLKYPAVTWFDAVAARALLNFLTDTLVAYLLLAGILIFVDVRLILSFGPIVQSFVLAAALAFGVGLINCVIVGFFPIWSTIWSIITRPLFLGSGVFWIYRDLPPVAQDILWWNPLVHILGLSRQGYYPTYEPQYISMTFLCTLILVLIFLGLVLMRRYHLEILSRR